MTKLQLLNANQLEGVFVAADEATNLANGAAEKALDAAQKAYEAAGRLATIEELLPAALAILRAELGSAAFYNPRGPWLPTGLYRAKDLVYHTLEDGVIRAFLAVTDPPQGTPPTDTTYWRIYEGGEADAAKPTLSLTVSETEALVVAPGGTSQTQLVVEIRDAPADTPLVWEVLSDEPGLSGAVTALPDAPQTQASTELNPNEPETAVEDESWKSYHVLTVMGTPATPGGRYALTVTARAADWVDDPNSSRYGLRDVEPLEVVVAAVIAPPSGDATATYAMSGKDGYTKTEFARDSGPNALHLVAKGDVRPNTQADGWICEGTPGSVLHTPPLTGHAMNAANEWPAIIPNPELLADGTVVSALSSTTRADDYACAIKTSEGFKLRISSQGAAGAVVVDSAAIPLDTRPVIVTDPAAGTVTLYGLKGAKSIALPRPAWTSAGVVGSFYGILQPGGVVLNPGAGQVLAARPHKVVLDAVRRDRNAQELIDLYEDRKTSEVKPEFPTGTRLILLMKPGQVTVDRTFFDPGTHDLTLLGNAAAGAEGGIVTTGAAGSGARTQWLPDVTWERDFTLAYLADGFFDDPLALCQLALGTKNNSAAWFKLRPNISGTDYQAVFSLLASPIVRGVLSVEKRLRHLFVLRYDAAKRTLVCVDGFSGKATPPLVVGAVYTGPVGLSLGVAYLGKASSTAADLGATESSPTRSGGLWLGTRTYAKEEDAALLALGVKAVVLTPTGGGATPEPSPATSTLVGNPNFTEASLGSGDLKKYFETYIKTGYFYLPNSQRDNPIGDHRPWEKEYVSRYKIKTYNGVAYRDYDGPTCGAYFLGRGIASLSYKAVSMAFRATKDLRILDVACGDLESLMDAARDESGIGSDKPDGFQGFAYGCDAQQRLFFAPGDSRNTAIISFGKITYSNMANGNEGMKKLTGIEVQLEEGLMVAWMVAALGAHQNMHQFSPTYEPVGNRPATPQYYRRVRDKAVKVYLDTCKKWDAYYGDQRMSELPMHIRRTLPHSALNEIAAKVAYAKIKNGAAWLTSAEYKEAERAWKLLFGPMEKVGAGQPLGRAFWHEAVHPKWGKCVFWTHSVRRYQPGSTKDSTGEYVSYNNSDQDVHPNNYTDHDYGAMQFMHEEGCPFVAKEWLSKIANLQLATLNLGNIFIRINTSDQLVPIPYGMHGNEYVPSLSSPWGTTKKSTGAQKTLLASSQAAGIAAYDVHGELEPLVISHYGKYGGTRQQPGAGAALMFAAAKREGRL